MRPLGPAFCLSNSMLPQHPSSEWDSVVPVRRGLDSGAATMSSLSSGSAVTTKATKAKKGAEQRLKQVQRAAVLLKQVSDPTRLQVILMLAEGEKHVGGLCEELNQSQPAVSHHLALLRHGSIIAPRRQGKNNYYGLTETGEMLAGIVKGILS